MIIAFTFISDVATAIFKFPKYIDQQVRQLYLYFRSLKRSSIYFVKEMACLVACDWRFHEALPLIGQHVMGLMF